MSTLSLRKLRANDKHYFANWWRDETLLRLTSGITKPVSDKEVDEYFAAIYKSPAGFEYMVVAGTMTVGHLSLVKRKNYWYETQIVIGDSRFRNKGYGTKAIQLLLQRAKRLGISKICLEVRPTNTRAIKAYEKCGFKKVRLKRHPRNRYLPETLRMELK